MAVSSRRQVGGLVIVAVTALFVCSALARDPWSLGRHDWDAMESYRLFAVQSVRQFGEFPFWDPYACGGYPFWSGPESGTTLVSPLLPVYMVLPLALAMRVEIASLLFAGLVGTWLLAGRFCRDPLLKAAVCVIAVLNSRWALQAASGHTWHLYYALLPWLMLAFMHSEQARPGARALCLSLISVLLALMVYSGAIYPFPHSVIALGLYAAVKAYQRRQWRPLLELGAVTLLAVGLSAPKALPLLDTMSRFPRLVSSHEITNPIVYLLALVARSDATAIWSSLNFNYAFHENGIYIGIPALLALGIGLWRHTGGAELRALSLTAALLFWLSLGAIGPWLLLHCLPPFRSQHVPFRFAYPALLFAAILAARGWEERLARLGPRRPIWDAGLLLVVALIAADVGFESRACLARGFGVHPGPVTPRAAYVQTLNVPSDLATPEANGPASLGTHLAGVGAIHCGSFHGLNTLAAKDAGGYAPGLGAHGLGEAAYRGEVYLESGQGSASFSEWTPSRVRVSLHGAREGDLLILNQNFDPSWRANGVKAVDHESLNAYRVQAANESVVFEYRPRTLTLGLVLCSVSLGSLALILLFARRGVPRVRERRVAPVLLEHGE